LLDDSARLASMREACRTMGKPNAAAEIAEDALKLLD
jgi:UDP-N-acetylglucosamine:LPS N-acetylglucosamine transferase